MLFLGKQKQEPSCLHFFMCDKRFKIPRPISVFRAACRSACATMCAAVAARAGRARSSITSPVSSGTPYWPSNVSTGSDCGLDRRPQHDARSRRQHERPVRQCVRRERRERPGHPLRMQNRAARRQVVGRRSRRGRDDQPSAFTCETNCASTSTSISIMRASAPRVTTMSLSARCRGDDAVRADDPAREQQPRFDRGLAGHEPIERRRAFRAADLRQESEPPEIDAEQRRVVRRMRDGAGGIEQRAVAAERDHHVASRGRVARGAPSAIGRRARRRRRSRFDDRRAAAAIRATPRLRPAPRAPPAACGGRSDSRAGPACDDGCQS